MTAEDVAVRAPRCIACERGHGPWSLHHFDPDGCKGTFGGATFTLEGSEPLFTVRRIEPDVPADDRARQEVG